MSKLLNKVDEAVDRRLTHDRALWVVTAGLVGAVLFGHLVPTEYLEAGLLGVNLIWIWR